MTLDIHGDTAGWNPHGWSAVEEAAVLDEANEWMATCHIQQQLDLSRLPETDLRVLRDAAVTVHGYVETGPDLTGETCFGALIATGGRWIGLELIPGESHDLDDPANADLVAYDAFVYSGSTLAEVFLSPSGFRWLEGFTVAGTPPDTIGFLSAAVRGQLAALPAPVTP
ncbi:hypothetical protein ACFU7Y_08645 [Kitasatospora sp. NPDC057542]|uniref:hypothetical protein n=1 Tax=Kitasatospora sp. NPDC057542 TaxID=3346162 RepID=UPI0036AC3CA2